MKKYLIEYGKEVNYYIDNIKFPKLEIYANNEDEAIFDFLQLNGSYLKLNLKEFKLIPKDIREEGLLYEITKSLDKIVKFNINKFKSFVPATHKDIYIGNMLYLISDEDELCEKEIEEVINPNCQQKAFSANDGCRYGLKNLFTIKKGEL